MEKEVNKKPNKKLLKAIKESDKLEHDSKSKSYNTIKDLLLALNK
jgi:hypothetical protein